jgi:hypothetical protein
VTFQGDLFSQDVPELFQKLRSVVPSAGMGHAPPETASGIDVDVHFKSFLYFVHKYSHRLKLEFRVTQATGGGFNFVLISRASNAQTLLPPGQTFLFPLVTVIQWGVYAEQVTAFRDVYDLADDKEFFQIFIDGKQV